MRKLYLFLFLALAASALSSAGTLCRTESNMARPRGGFSSSFMTPIELPPPIITIPGASQSPVLSIRMPLPLLFICTDSVDATLEIVVTRETITSVTLMNMTTGQTVSLFGRSSYVKGLALPGNGEYYIEIETDGNCYQGSFTVDFLPENHSHSHNPGFGGF